MNYLQVVQEIVRTPNFRDQYRHAKTLLLIGDAAPALALLGVPAASVNGSDDAGLLLHKACDDTVSSQFIAALARHRHFERETHPTLV